MATKVLLQFIIFLFGLPLHAQERPSEKTVVPAPTDERLPDEGAYRYDDAMQLWRGTMNAAGMTVDSVLNRGYSAFNYQYCSGSHRRVQEGCTTNDLGFFTEQYRRIGRYLYGYGRFRFGAGQIKDRAWSDVRRTYLSNPFISGSPVKGRYATQDFDLGARLATRALKGWRAGLSLDYKAGDLSRLTDPRTRSLLLDYRLTPAFTYSHGAHTIGLSGGYGRYKEKIPNITTVQQRPNLYYYQMSGLEAGSGSVSGYMGYCRQYVRHTLAAEMAYGYNSSAYTGVHTLGITRGVEQVQEEYRREPGRFFDFIYSLASRNRLHHPAGFHRLDLLADYRQAYADENLTEQRITTDPEHGYTSQTYETVLTYRKRYQLRRVDVRLHYRYSVARAHAVTTYFGLLTDFCSTDERRLLPLSRFNRAGLNLSAEGGHALFGRRLFVDLLAGRHFVFRSDIRFADPSTDYAQAVWLPDQTFYNADYWLGRVALTYQFPLRVMRWQNRWFVSAFYATTQAGNRRTENRFGLSVGIFH